MATKIYIISSNEAFYTDEEFSAVQTELYTEGVFDDNGSNDDMEVVENSPQDMSVNINTGGVLIEYLKNAISWKVVGKSNAVENVAITPNGGGTNRVDAVIAHMKQDEPNALKNNVLEFLVIPGTGATALTDGAIDTAVGDTNWYRLADVTVVPAATQIFNADIADTRLPISIGLNQGGYRSRYIGDGSSLYGILKNPLASSLLADTPSAYNIGATLTPFANVYADDFWGSFHGDGSGITNITPAQFTANAGENINGTVTPLAVCLERGTGSTTGYTLGGGTTSQEQFYTNRWIAQSFTTGANSKVIREVAVTLSRVGNIASGGTITCSIYTDDGTGKPNTVVGSSTRDVRIATSNQGVNFFFNNLAISPSTTYHVVLNVTGFSAGNCPSWAYSVTGALQGKSISTDGGTTWVSVVDRQSGTVQVYDSSFADDDVKIADSSDNNRIAFCGFVTDNVTVGNPATVISGGVVDGFTGLSVGEDYYLSTSGTISLNPGTNLIKIGKAVTPTKLQIDYGYKMNSNTFASSAFSSIQNGGAAYGLTENFHFIYTGFRPKRIWGTIFGGGQSLSGVVEWDEKKGVLIDYYTPAGTSPVAQTTMGVQAHLLRNGPFGVFYNSIFNIGARTDDGFYVSYQVSGTTSYTLGALTFIFSAEG